MAAAVAIVPISKRSVNEIHTKIVMLFETEEDNNDADIDFANPELNKKALDIIKAAFTTFEERTDFNEFKVYLMDLVFNYVCYRQLIPSLHFLLSKIENINIYTNYVMFDGITIRLTPLVQICSTQNNLIVYNMLVEKGGSLYPVDAVEYEKKIINKYLINNSTLTIYNEVFGFKDIVNKFNDLFLTTSPYMDINEMQLFFEKHRLFEDYKSLFYFGLVHSNNKATICLVNIYNKNAVFGKMPSADTVEAGLMFSQKGFTCGQDSLFTFLFENDRLSPLWSRILSVTNSSTDSCPLLPTAGDSYLSERYKQSFESALVRYKRFKSISTKNIDTRRKLSVNNSVWKNTFNTLNTLLDSTNLIPTYKGLTNKDLVYLFDNVINKNIFMIEGLTEFTSIPISITPTLHSDTAINTNNVIGCVCLIISYNEYKKGKLYGHMISIFKKNSSWYLADNEIGFLHKFSDPLWVEETLLPRIIVSITKFNTTIDNISSRFLDKSVYFVIDKNLNRYYLNGQFVCLDGKNYPDLPINPFEFRDNKWFFQSAVFIVDNGGKSVSGTVTGGGSAAAVGGYRRKTGRRLKRHHSIRKTRRNVGGKTHSSY